MTSALFNNIHSTHEMGPWQDPPEEWREAMKHHKIRMCKNCLATYTKVGALILVSAEIQAHCKCNLKKLRVWWIPQVPGKPFFIPVASVEQGVKIMDVLADYDKFQYDENIKPDYCNVGGLEQFDTEDKEDDPAGAWGSWCDEDSGEENPKVWLKNRNKGEEK